VLVGLAFVWLCGWLLLLFVFVLLRLRRVMAEIWLITCHKLAAQPIKEVIDIEECGATFG